MFDFPNEYYTKDRNPKKFIYEYLTNMKTYIKKLYPDLSDEMIEDKIKKIVISKIKSPTIFFTKKEKVDTELVHTSLLDFSNLIKDDIITPSGGMFCKSSEETSFFTEYIEPKRIERKKEKAKMMRFEELSDSFNALLSFYEQLSIKIGINGISGSMCSNIFFKSMNCYNSITSSVRHNIMLGYAFVEKFLMSNIYFENEDDAINYIINLLNIFPSEETLQNICIKYNLKKISTLSFKSFIYECIHMSHIEKRIFEHLDELIDSLSENERTFMYYAQNLNHLFWENESVFIPFLRNILSISYNINRIMEDSKYNNKESIHSLQDKQLLTLVFTIGHQLFKNQTINEIDKSDHEAKAIIKFTYYELEERLNNLRDLMDVFMFIDMNLHKPFKHTNMIRKTVILSDTDSIIFTTIKWIIWFTKKITIDEESINFHSLLVFLTSKFLDHIFCIFSKDANIETKNLKQINIKNEFFFSSFLRTGISKHYAALMRVQEGIVLPTPKFELKGKNFKGSDLSVDNLKSLEDFIKYILNSVEKNPNLDFNEIVKIVMKHEMDIYKNVKGGHNNYLSQVPIKDKMEYKIPYSSNWFYYHLWQNVFAKKYGDISIPQKCKSVSLKFKLNSKNLNRLDFMENISPEIYKKFISFLLRYKNKNITQIIIPPTVNIPKEIRSLIDYKKIIIKQCYGMYLILRSFNIGPVTISKNNKFLLSEIYANESFV